MASTTTRWGFRKPSTSDTVSVATDINASMDIIDAALGTTVCTSTTRPASPVQGQTVYETDTRREMIYNGTVWLSTAPLVAAIAFGGDVVINNTATLAGVTALTLPVAANTNYVLDGSLIYSAATAADVQFSLTVPASAQWVVSGAGLLTSTAATSGSIERATVYNAGWSAGGNGVSAILTSTPTGYVPIGATAGTVQLRWAQATANASNATLYGGSWIRLTRV